MLLVLIFGGVMPWMLGALGDAPYILIPEK